jgi:hypothetical protein
VFRIIVPAVVLLSLALGVAVVQWFNAQKESETAQAERKKAVADLALAKQQLGLTDAARDRNEKQTRDAQDAARAISQVATELAELEKRRPNDAAALAKARRTLQEQVKALGGGTPDGVQTTPPTPEGPGARVYIQIADESQRTVARVLRKELSQIRLDSGAVVAPGIELVKNGPPRTVLRCFKSAECDGDGRRLVAAINKLVATPVELQDLSDRYGDTTQLRPLHFEIWFAPGEIRMREAADNGRPSPSTAAGAVKYEILACSSSAAAAKGVADRVATVLRGMSVPVIRGSYAGDHPAEIMYSGGFFQVRYAAPPSASSNAAIRLLERPDFKSLAPWRELPSKEQSRELVSVFVCPAQK